MYTARKDEEAKGKKKTVVDALPEKVQKIAHSEKKKANSKVVEEDVLRTQQTVLSGEVCCTH